MTARALVRAAGLVAVLSAADAAPVAARDAGPDVREALAPKARAAFDLLMQAKRFDGAAVGEGGKLSDNAAAVRAVIRDREAPAAFQALYDRGPVVARLYALAAFWYLRPGDFSALVQAVRQRDGAMRVATQFGCSIGAETVAALLEKRARDAVRLTPGTGLYAFVCAARKSGSYTADIVGGALPIEIVEGTTIMDARCAHPPPLPEYLKPRR